MTDTPLPLTTRLGQMAVNALLRGLILLSLALPYRVRVPLMGWLVAHVVAPVAGYRRRVRDNLALVMPDLPEAEVRALCLAVPDNAGRTLIEMYSGDEFIAHARDAVVSGPGLAALDRARNEGRPVILVSAHFGNYDAGRANLIARGFDLGGLYRPLSNRYFNTHYVASISKIGTPLFIRGRRGMMQMVKHLRDGGSVCILTDLNAHDGVPLQFFGKPALTSLVTAEMALRYQAELIPVYVIRAANGLDFSIEVHKPIAPSDALTMTQAVNDGLEALVREHMGQWFWIHRRWKDGGLPDDQDDLTN
jgi:KDO2-lipid IV(A) lauroyltransferase